MGWKKLTVIVVAAAALVGGIVPFHVPDQTAGNWKWKWQTKNRASTGR